MHVFIEREEAGEIGGGDSGALIDQQTVERGDVRFAGGTGGIRDRAAFQRFANELRIVDRRHADRGDEGADLRDDAQKALFRQPPEHFAHRGAAEAIGVANPGFGQRVTRAQLATHDPAM